MHTFIQYIHKHLVIASFGTLVLAGMAWIADAYANPHTTSAASMIDVSVSVTPYPTVVANEELAGFLLYYKTRGGGISEGIQVSATLPVGMTLVSSFPASPTQQGNTYTWTNLPNNYGPVVLEVSVQGAEGSTQSIQANVSTISNDTNPSNNTAQGTVTILNTQSSDLSSDMQISLTAAQNTVTPGATIPYTIQYTNNGPDVAGESVIVMTVPSELTYVTGSRTLDPMSTTDTLIWNVYDLDSGEQGQITINVLLSNIVDPGEAVFSYVTIGSTNNDTTTPSNNQAYKSILVAGGGSQPTTPASPSTPVDSTQGAEGGAGEPSPTIAEVPEESSVIADETQSDAELPTSSGFLFTLRGDEALVVPSTNTCASVNELQSAYQFAYSNDITTMASLAQARMCDGVIRAELAKMISNYAINVLGKAPNTDIDCAFSDMSGQPQDLQQAAITACQLGLMGREDGKVALSFNPKQTVSRAIFGTAFSRLLYGDEHNNSGSTRYDAHLDALFTTGIIKNITPTLQELRGYIMIMMQRSEQ